MSDTTRSTVARRPLTPWELPKLLEPMHRWKRATRAKGPKVWRSHFLPILGFVYRNRFAVASQIQRRFAKAMPSDRTARRHLAELERTGCLGVADTRSVSPLFPKVYFVTGRGVRKIEESLCERGRPGTCCKRDRRRPEAYSPSHVLHEVLTTEFLLNVWETIEPCEDLKLLTVQRRALERHPAFLVAEAGRRSRLKPDAMFVYRRGRGMMCCFLEIDNGTMSLRQMRGKLSRYEAWSKSRRGREYLLDIYRRNGAAEAKAVFRVLLVASDRFGGDGVRRMAALRRLARNCQVRDRLWLTTISALRNADVGQALRGSMWIRGSETERDTNSRGRVGAIFDE